MGDGRGLEHGTDRQPGVHAGVDRGDQSHRRQRIATQVEEGIVDAHESGWLNTEHLAEDPDQDLLGEGGRRTVLPGVLVIGCRQRAGVELAVDRQRQRIHRHHRGRNHIGRQPLGQCGA